MRKFSWRDSRAVVVLHESTTGPGHDLRDYLLKLHVKELIFITHPLLYHKENFKNVSKYVVYNEKRAYKYGKASHWVLPEPILYIKDVLYTLFWCFAVQGKIDVFVGVGNLNALSGIILKKLRKVNTVVYYVIDYVPNRFHNRIFNALYHSIERLAAEGADASWNLSPRMISAREKKWKKKFPNQIVVPHGVHYARIKHVPFEKIKKNEIIYMGGLFKKQGIQLVLESLPKVVKKLPETKFVIIGKGPYEKELKLLVRKLKLRRNVSFFGYIPDHAKVENKIAEAALAMALYDKKFDEFTYFTDPGKIKNYLGAGVPVIVTDVPYIARELEKEKCGIVVPYNSDRLASVLIDFLTDDKRLREFRKNASVFARQYDWSKVFEKAFNNTFL